MVYLPTFWLIFMANVGKYTSPMDPMGFKHTNQKTSQIFKENAKRLSF